MDTKHSTTHIEGQLNLPDEVSAKQAAAILGVDKKTVLSYYRDGLIPARNIAPPSSSRPVFRFPLKNVLSLRSGYEYAEARETTRKSTRSRGLAPARQAGSHIQLRHPK